MVVKIRRKLADFGTKSRQSSLKIDDTSRFENDAVIMGKEMVPVVAVALARRSL